MERAIVQEPIMERAILNEENTVDKDNEIIQIKIRLAQLENIVNEMNKPLTWQELAASEQTV